MPLTVQIICNCLVKLKKIGTVVVVREKKETEEETTDVFDKVTSAADRLKNLGGGKTIGQ